MSPAFVEPAPAKINLFLHITGKRADGYHLLDSLVVFAGIGDRLSAADADGLSLRLTGPFAGGLAGEADNLVLRAALALAEAAGITANAALQLEKNLPVSSGIGGGSADAAAALRLLSRMWAIALPPDDLQRIAIRLGADVPVCLGSRPTRMGGVGEILDSAPALPDAGLVLINPGIALATAEVFRARRGAFSPQAELPIGWGDVASMAAALAVFRNDLEQPAVALRPAIMDALTALAALPGCLLARMSGSGATCFGVFASSAEATKQAALLARPGWWCWGGPMLAA